MNILKHLIYLLSGWKLTQMIPSWVIT